MRSIIGTEQLEHKGSASVIRTQRTHQPRCVFKSKLYLNLHTSGLWKWSLSYSAFEEETAFLQLILCHLHMEGSPAEVENKLSGVNSFSEFRASYFLRVGVKKSRILSSWHCLLLFLNFFSIPSILPLPFSLEMAPDNSSFVPTSTQEIHTEWIKL